MKTVIKRFVFDVTVSDSAVSKTFDLDKNIEIVKGILMTSNKDNLLYYRGSQKIEINKEEVFPDGYASKLLMSGINVQPNLRFYDIGKFPAGNKSVKVEYKDLDDGETAFNPYRIELYLICEIEQE